MSEAATLPTTRPTTRDEDWRYADPEWLAAADPVALANWEDIAVPADDVRTEIRIAREGVERLRVAVGRNAGFELFAINGAAPYARLEVEVTLEEGAHFEFGGVTIGGGAARQEFVTRTIHAHPNATSNQVVRAVQWGHSTGNFLGRIEVVRDAQKTDAAQNFRAILLEKGASANAKPELEIFADDVKCAHGAAIGKLDEQAGFYMAARGLPPEVARKLLIRAFIADAFAALEDEALRERMLETALGQLDEGAV
jgi:Fe-S cluster assembly protein SufD